MTNQHPITPPPDKIHNWLQLEKVDYTLGQIITLAAQWGADQELEAVLHLCDEWLTAETIRRIRATRRPSPKPPETIEVDGFTYRLVR
jgi:hypothetical protein